MINLRFYDQFEDFLQVLRSRKRWRKNYLRSGAGAKIEITGIFLKNYFLQSVEEKPPLRLISYV